MSHENLDESGVCPRVGAMPARKQSPHCAIGLAMFIPGLAHQPRRVKEAASPKNVAFHLSLPEVRAL